MNMKKYIVMVLLLFIYMATTGMNTVINIVEEPVDRYEYVFNSVVDDKHAGVIKAIISVESGGDTLAVSHTGDYGIMQVNKRTWSKKYDFSKMNELEYGLKAGYEIYLMCYNRAGGNIREALKLYNGRYSYADKVMRRIHVR